MSISGKARGMAHDTTHEQGQHGGGGHDDHGEWFRHDAFEGDPQAEHAAHVSPAALGIAFLAITFGVLALVLILVIYFQQYNSRLQTTRLEGTGSADQYLEYRAGAKTRLSQVSAIDRENDVYRIPIERAMEIVTEEYAQQARARASAE